MGRTFTQNDSKILQGTLAMRPLSKWMKHLAPQDFDGKVFASDQAIYSSQKFPPNEALKEVTTIMSLNKTSIHCEARIRPK